MKCLPVLISGALMNEAESCLEGARRLSCGKLEDEIEIELKLYFENVPNFGAARRR